MPGIDGKHHPCCAMALIPIPKPQDPTSGVWFLLKGAPPCSRPEASFLQKQALCLWLRSCTEWRPLNCSWPHSFPSATVALTRSDKNKSRGSSTPNKTALSSPVKPLHAPHHSSALFPRSCFNLTSENCHASRIMVLGVCSEHICACSVSEVFYKYQIQAVQRAARTECASFHLAMFLICV